ncbi:MAG: hypothetical protein ACYT04_17430 [Nostoc sp.]
MEDYLIARLISSVETRAVIGTIYGVVTEALGHSALAKRQTQARQHCRQKANI